MPYFNPINYASGLLDELKGAERADRAETAADIRKELAEVAKTLEGLDSKSLDEGGPDLLTAVRAQLAEVLGPKKAPRTTAAAPAPEKAVPPKTK